MGLQEKKGIKEHIGLCMPRFLQRILFSATLQPWNSPELMNVNSVSDSV